MRIFFARRQEIALLFSDTVHLLVSAHVLHIICMSCENIAACSYSALRSTWSYSQRDIWLALMFVVGDSLSMELNMACSYSNASKKKKNQTPK
jgi:hypothetical protein